MHDGQDRSGGFTVSRRTRTTATIAAAAGLLAGLAGQQAVAQSTTTQITQHGITFQFDQAYEFGQFANGDFWVAAAPGTGQLTITGMTPDYDGTHNGWMVNPVSSDRQSFDTRMPNLSFNAAALHDAPYVARPGDSIIKAISRGQWTGPEPTRYQTRPMMMLETASVLTVLDAAPVGGGANAFRPSYVGTDKRMFSVDDLRLDLLPGLAPTASTPSLGAQARRFERVQLEHVSGWTARDMRPMQHMPDYGAEIGSNTGAAALRLMLDDPIDDRMPLLVNYVQYGLDLYGAMMTGTRWEGNGGHNLGRKLPMVFAAVMLDDEQMKQNILNAPGRTFHEDDSTYFSANARTSLWGHPGTEAMYWLNQHEDRGSRTVRDPYGYIDGGYTPGGSYQFCCNSQPFKGAALAMLLMPELRDVWDDESYLDYVDRWVTSGAWTKDDPYQSLGDGAQDDIGRYPELHGTAADGGHYGSAFVNAMWEAYRGGPAVLMPYIAPHEGGEFDEPVLITLESPHMSGVELRYTLNGSTPTEDSLLYTEPFWLTGEDVTIRVRGFKAGYFESAINSMTVSAVPEPGSMLLLAAGAPLLLMRRRACRT